MALLLAISAVAPPDTRGEERRHGLVNLSTSILETASGIRTDRLSPRQLRVWRRIERIVFAKDGSGSYSHPRLRSLWQWVEASGSVVQVEFPDPKAPGDHQAGRFQIEESDPNGTRHIASIRLCLPVIDRALVRKRVPGAKGFVRFERLKKEERYAEILGHELAHAVWILGDRQHALVIEELDRELEELDRGRRSAARGTVRDEQTLQRLKRIESLITTIERPAETAEEEVWQELFQGRSGKSETPALALAGTAPERASSVSPASGASGSESTTEVLAFMLASN
jgi:hypothetical protein